LEIDAAEALSSTAIPLLFEKARYCRLVCLARKAETVAVALIVRIKPVPVVLTGEEALVVMLAEMDVLEDEELADEALEDEVLAEEALADEELEDADEELEDDALAPILLVEVEALMGPTEIVVEDDVPTLVLLELEAPMGPIELEALEDEVVVPAPIGPTLLLKEVVDTWDVLAPMGPTLAEVVEVVLALIWLTEEELEAYQSSHAWLLA
jgi:hypothetical protein